MFKTPQGKEIFVVDGHTHFWDGSPENQSNIHGKQFIECFYAYHTNLSPKEQLWDKAKFEKYSADDLFRDLFVDGPDDVAILTSTKTGSTPSSATPKSPSAIPNGSFSTAPSIRATARKRSNTSTI
jgi:hypothetical protein